jgi:hypothetical protein
VQHWQCNHRRRQHLWEAVLQHPKLPCKLQSKSPTDLYRERSRAPTKLSETYLDLGAYFEDCLYEHCWLTRLVAFDVFLTDGMAELEEQSHGRIGKGCNPALQLIYLYAPYAIPFFHSNTVNKVCCAWRMSTIRPLIHGSGTRLGLRAIPDARHVTV